MNKILTLIIPTYNMEKYLGKCLTSLVISDSELMKRLEVLVIIDGATDRSSEIAHGYESKWPETFRVIDKENGNYGSCINRGLKEATGRYIKVLDADDWFDTEVFERYLFKLQEVDVDLVLNDYNYVLGGVKRNLCEVASCLSEDDIHNFEDFVNIPAKNLIVMHTIAYRTKNLKKINYHQTEGISYTDQEWNFLPMTQVKRIVSIHGGLYQYLIGREGQTMDPSVKKNKIGELIKVFNVLIEQRLQCAANYVYIEYMDKLMSAYFYDFYIKSNDSELCVIKKRFDKEIMLKSPILYKQMNSWGCYCSNQEPYIALWRSPWKTIMHALISKGYKEFIVYMDYAYINNLIAPLWLASLFYKCRDGLKKVLEDLR